MQKYNNTRLWNEHMTSDAESEVRLWATQHQAIYDVLSFVLWSDRLQQGCFISEAVFVIAKDITR